MNKEKMEFEYIESLGKWQCRIDEAYKYQNPTHYGHGKDKKEAEKNCRKEIKGNYDYINCDGIKKDGAKMNIQEFAKMLNGRDYRKEITKEEEKQAKELGFVVVFGYSDDNMEFNGAINDEFGCYDGGIAAIDENGLIKECDCDCQYYRDALNNATKIEACWWNDGDYTWTYETKIPHEKFDILEDGEKWCQGIVFDIKSL